MGMDLERVLWSVYVCNLQHQWYLVIQLQQKKKKSLLIHIYLLVRHVRERYVLGHEWYYRFTLRSTQLKEDCEMPDLSPITLWNDPAAKTQSTWSCGGTGFDWLQVIAQIHKQFSWQSETTQQPIVCLTDQICVVSNTLLCVFFSFNHKINNPIIKIPLKHLSFKNWSKFDYIVFLLCSYNLSVHCPNKLWTV